MYKLSISVTITLKRFQNFFVPGFASEKDEANPLSGLDTWAGKTRMDLLVCPLKKMLVQSRRLEIGLVLLSAPLIDHDFVGKNSWPISIHLNLMLDQ